MSLDALVAGTAATLLGGIGALHVVWSRSPWPLATWDDLSTTVIGRDVVPPAWACLGVAGAMGTAAVLTLARAGVVSTPQHLPAWLVPAGVWTATGVLALRGAAGAAEHGLVVPRAHGLTVPDGTSRPYAVWDAQLYSPLCLLLAAMLGHVAAREPGPPTPVTRWDGS